ncbi:helix-turn-helix domain-containing protein [Candidatus Enterococcus ikei]|uniref:Helix-turn-helix domain-containing protein n=1 Tax=Candidatus Enterococcus ikei TaxID=2815326 RepID=A0ABS3GVZ3_9ENTE|nr:helix-turn-helix domain-containing protein [Enterococcus sp. DIV0869a]MBO0439058.1 helix-turn-helix domain-containing protein [Enterococcus sp. DIV0869a]
MDSLFILSLFKHGYKARTSTLYHLLKGKRTSSVLLYGFLYENLPFFQLTPELTEDQFNRKLDELVEQELLILNADNEAQLTVQGKQKLAQEKSCFTWIDNYRFGKTDETIWRLVQFVVQVISHLSYEDKQYIPLEQSPLYQKQVKKYIKSIPKVQLIETVRKELTEIFSYLPKKEANFFAQQFSGYQQIGKTSYQSMDDTDEPFQRFLQRKEMLHHLLHLILQMPEGSSLRALILPLVKQNENQSMNETKHYLAFQLSLEELAKQRRVKKSTVQDHLMELALTEAFPFNTFITQKTYHLLDEHSGPYQEWVYRSIKQSNPELDYFEFRLYQIQKLREERDQNE